MKRISTLLLTALVMAFAICVSLPCEANSQRAGARKTTRHTTKPRAKKSTTPRLTANMFVSISNENGKKVAELKDANVIIKSLKQAGFTLKDSQPETMYASDETPVKAIYETYKKGGITFSIQHSIEEGYSMQSIGFFFTDCDKLLNFIKTFSALGFTEPDFYTNGMNCIGLGSLYVNYRANEGEIVYVQ